MSKGKVGSGAGVLLLVVAAGLVIGPSWWNTKSGDRDDTFVLLRVLRQRTDTDVRITYTTLTIKNSVRTRDAEWQRTLNNVAGNKITLTATQDTTQQMRCEIWNDDGRLVDESVRHSPGTVHCTYRVRS